jgi:hypothetical protein
MFTGSVGGAHCSRFHQKKKKGGGEKKQNMLPTEQTGIRRELLTSDAPDVVPKLKCPHLYQF